MSSPATAPPGGGARACAVTGCGRPLLARGFCRAHYLRWRRHGDPRPDRPVARRRPRVASYRSALRRVRAARGPAKAWPCADCAAPAEAWSYDGTDPDERADGPGRRYSLDPARYRPRCRSCQRRATTPGSPPDRLDIERAARLYRADASSTGIAALLGTSPSTVLRALRAHGVAIRPGGRADPPTARRQRGTHAGGRDTGREPDRSTPRPKLVPSPIGAITTDATTDISRTTENPSHDNLCYGSTADCATTQGHNGKSTPTHHDPVDPAASPGGPARGGRGGEATPC
jgi:hypothetical protein